MPPRGHHPWKSRCPPLPQPVPLPVRQFVLCQRTNVAKHCLTQLPCRGHDNFRSFGFCVFRDRESSSVGFLLSFFLQHFSQMEGAPFDGCTWSVNLSQLQLEDNFCLVSVFSHFRGYLHKNQSIEMQWLWQRFMARERNKATPPRWAPLEGKINRKMSTHCFPFRGETPISNAISFSPSFSFPLYILCKSIQNGCPHAPWEQQENALPEWEQLIEKERESAERVSTKVLSPGQRLTVFRRGGWAPSPKVRGCSWES